MCEGQDGLEHRLCVLKKVCPCARLVLSTGFATINSLRVRLGGLKHQFSELTKLFMKESLKTDMAPVTKLTSQRKLILGLPANTKWRAMEKKEGPERQTYMAGYPARCP